MMEHPRCRCTLDYCKDGAHCQLKIGAWVIGHAPWLARAILWLDGFLGEVVR